MTEKVANGLFVSIDYKGSLPSGDVFDTSYGRQPLEVKIGAGQLIKGFEKQVVGMSLNEKKTFTLEPEDAYGLRDENLVRAIPRTDFPPEMEPQVGMTVGLQGLDGHPVPAQIVQLDHDRVTLDLNHPLAGETLTFEIEVVGISDTQTQIPAGCGSSCDCSADKPC